MEKDLLEYLIRGKDYILKKLIISEIISIPCLCIIAFLIHEFSVIDIMLFPIIIIFACPLFLNLWYINHYFFYRIEIYPDGFYIRTNLFKGKSYHYNEILSAFIDGKTLHNKYGKPSETIYFFRFVDSQGKRRRIYFDDTYCINEIRLIVDRISK